MSGPVLTFLSDYGLQDEFVGICHGVIARICPAARIIDLTHGVTRHDIRAGALVLADAVPYLPVGVHLAVVDPDVGAERRAVALATADGRRLVGPDNGLLPAAAERAGGVVEAVDIAHSRFRLEPVSATFHGRDIFAPVAAHLAAGEALAGVGAPLDPRELITLELPRPSMQDGVLIAHVLHVDRFGNLQLDAGHEDLEGSGLRLGRPVAVSASTGQAERLQYVRTFADVETGELLLYEDAQRRLALAVSHGDAAARLGLGVDDELRICPSE
jgi:hypothetical protein